MNIRKTVFIIGILLCIVSAILFFTIFLGDLRVPIVIGIVGILIIGFSGYRLLKSI